ncbi:MAG: aminoacyl-histidine dipeptidase [Clostridia bacterium]|nr:aminoacyl-histidine dipeptidase [Clostridia bacterium]
MAILKDIEPKNVFKFFEKISSIPHGSGNTKEISDYLCAFAKEKGFEYYQDKMNNVIIKKEASSGYENSEPLIIQAHIDMVCEKEAGCTKDMSKEGIDLKVEGDFISANGTTLGADDGIGVAYALAVLDATDLSHPPIEAVFTVDEEIGMLGAFEIDVSRLKGKRMLNIDAGAEHTITVSCAGGITTKSTFNIKREDFNGTALNIKVSSLSGGHSGVMIHKGGANSNSLMGRLLCDISKTSEFRLSKIDGGFKDNAIPTLTLATIICKDKDKCINAISKLEEDLKNEYSVTDPELKISVEECEYIVPLCRQDSDKVVLFLNIAPNGVQTMSSQIKDLVQTSLNFAITSSSEDKIECVISARSSVDSQKYMIADKLNQLTIFLGGSVETWGDYPGWEFKKNSEFRDTFSRVFKNKFGCEPKIEAIHAGLECGLFSGRIPGLDVISYEPNMWDVHTPRERLSISSSQRVWELIVELLRELK